MNPENYELFKQKRWREVVITLEKNKKETYSDQQALTILGISYMRLRKHDLALRIFEKLNKHIPALAALNWAALLAHKRKFDEALGILSKTNHKFAHKFAHKKEDELFDWISCVILDDILSVISNTRDLGVLKFMKMPGRKRMTRLLNLGLLPSLRMLNTFGRFVGKYGLAGGKNIQDLVNSFRGQCWVYDFLAQPDFLKGHYMIEGMKNYEHSKEVYRNIFLTYLDYLINAQENIRDLLLHTQKPGDAHALYLLVREKQPSNVLEVGTFVGFSTALIAQALKDNGKGRLFSIDPNTSYFSIRKPLRHASKMLETLMLDSFLEIHEGFFSNPRNNSISNTPVLGSRISEILPEIDLAFIDGDHATTAVLQDFMLLLPILKSKSTIMFHDIKTWPTVRQGILTLFNDDIWKARMNYFEFIPSGCDGIGVVKICKKPQ